MILAVDTTNQLADKVVLCSLAAGVLSFGIGVALLCWEWIAERPVRAAAKRASEDLQRPATDVATDSPLKAQGGPGEAINAITNLAKALKDLDRSTRLLVVSMFFFAVAGAAAFGDAVGNDEEDSSTPNGLRAPVTQIG